MMNEFIWCCNESGHQILPDHVVPRCFLEQGGPAHVCSAVENKVLQAHFGESGGSDAAWIQPLQPSPRAKKTWRRYAPLRDNPALFRTFADVECNQESIVKFADRFGLLIEPQNGEPIRTWTSAISDMRSAVDCWEETQKTNPVPTSPSSSPLVVADQLGAEALKKQTLSLSVPDRIRAATRDNVLFELGMLAGSLGLTELAVSDYIAGKISRNISHVRTVLGFNRQSEGFTLQLVPTTLLEAMWLQFGQAVESNKTFRKCRHCRAWFDLSPKAARIDKVFCAEACKAKAYRRRLAKQEPAEPRVGAPSDAEINTKVE